MTLSQSGLAYISKNFGLSDKIVTSGISWYTTVGGQNYQEQGGTAQIVGRLVSGVVESLTITNPDRGLFTKSELDAANGSPVTLQDAKSIAQQDEPIVPAPTDLLLGVGIVAAVVIGLIVFKKK